jgi:pimeloyl-ACP methyl ester carboxylesterase
MPLDLVRATPATAWPLDPTPHKVLFVPVEKDVTLEVLDWGGAGRPVILLAGLGNTAHIFDQFAQKLTPHYHVYGITRRGFGASSSPVPWGGNYFPDRLGDDVLAVIDALHIDHPILIGHSIAGQELSSIGSRHPEKVAGLVYLEAAHGYAFYDSVHGDALDDIAGLEREFAALASTQDLRAEKAIVQQLLTAAIPRVEQDLRQELSYTQALPAELPSSALPDLSQAPSVRQAIILSAQKYTAIHAPVLAIFAAPPSVEPGSSSDPAALASATQDREETLNQVNAVRADVPGARVILIPNANHYIFQSNESDVLREINSFIASLP